MESFNYAKIGSHVFGCAICGKSLVPDDLVIDCPNCGAIICKDCAEEGALESHECEEEE